MHFFFFLRIWSELRPNTKSRHQTSIVGNHLSAAVLMKLICAFILFLCLTCICYITFYGNNHVYNSRCFVEKINKCIRIIAD